LYQIVFDRRRVRTSFIELTACIQCLLRVPAAVGGYSPDFPVF
jgi:hypothetical protein